MNGEPVVHSYTYIGGQLMREYIRKPKTETLYSAGSYCSDSAYCGPLAASQSGVPCEHDVCEIDDLTFHYDQTGIAGFTLRKRMTDTNFYYRKNLQGDIIEIYDENGGRIAAYSYDAWGNCSISYSINGIAELNPIRYRGYYYDSETKLYYLKSRYYDPLIGRFISADEVKYALEQSGEINGLNLFAYCLNNPVMLSDSTGTSWLSDAWNSVTGWVDNNIVQPVTSFFSDLGSAASRVWNSIDWVKVGFTALTVVGVSGVIGLSILTLGASSILCAGIIGATIGAGASIISQGLKSGYDKIGWKEVGTQAFIGGIAGIITAGILGPLGAHYGKLLGDAISGMRILGRTIGSVFGRQLMQSAISFIGSYGARVIGGALLYGLLSGKFEKANMQSSLSDIILDLIIRLLERTFIK